jgi:hypothetical protein
MGNLTYTSTNSLVFSGFEALQGGAAADTFDIHGTHTFTLHGGSGDDALIFADNSHLIGSFDGQSGCDTLDFSPYTTARRIVLTDVGTQNGFAGGDFAPLPAITGGFNNINVMVGSSDPASDDVFVGLNKPAQWVIGDICTYTTNPTLTFTSFETLVGGDANDTFTISGMRDVTLVGGAGDDTFVMTNGAGVSGSINGQGGTDTLEYGLTNMPPHDAGAGTAAGVRGGIFSIENFRLTAPPSPSIIPRSSIPDIVYLDEEVQLLKVLPPQYVPIITLVTWIRPGERVVLEPQFINILVVDPAVQVMLNAESAAFADIVIAKESDLPSVLPAGYRFVTSLNVKLFAENGAPIESLPIGTALNLSFALPENYTGRTFLLLYWDETLNDGVGGWVEIRVQILYRDPALNANIGNLQTYFRYWNVQMGEWVTLVDSLQFWDAQFVNSLGGWIEIPTSFNVPGQTGHPEAIASAFTNFTGTFVLVAVP